MRFYKQTVGKTTDYLTETIGRIYRASAGLSACQVGRVRYFSQIFAVSVSDYPTNAGKEPMLTRQLKLYVVYPNQIFRRTVGFLVDLFFAERMDSSTFVV